MSAEENKALIRYYFDEVMHRRNASAIDELFAPDFVAHTPQGMTIDLNGFKASVAMSHAAIPDIHVEIEDQVAEDEQVATRWRGSGTHNGSFAGVLATGKRVSVSTLVIHRVVDGRIVEMWEYFDLLGLFMQIGFPPMH